MKPPPRVIVAVVLILALATSPARSRADEPKPSFEQAYRAYFEGISSEDKEAREKALRAVQPTKEDIETLFPDHAKTLWPNFEQMNAFLLKNSDKFGEQMRRKGALKKVEGIDVRKDKTSGSYKRAVLAMIPKDIIVYDYAETHERGFSGAGPFSISASTGSTSPT